MPDMLFLKSKVGYSNTFYIKVDKRYHDQPKIDQIIIHLCISVGIIPIHKSDGVGGTMVTGNKQDTR